MSGRHQRAARRSWWRRRYVLVGVLVLAALVTAALVVASLRPDGGHPAAATKTSTTCKAGVALTVAADPTVAAVIADIADAWSARRPLVEGVCPTVTVRSQSSADAASAFAKTNTTLPDVWIPDSTLWVDNLRDAIRGADTAANSMWLSGPIATSPLVLATAPGHAASVRREAAGGWRTVFAHPAGLRTADPETSTDGLVSLLTATAALNGSAVAPSRELVDSFVTMSRAVARSPQAGLQALAAAPADDYRVLVSEQDVLQAAGPQSGGTDDPSQVTAVYPPGAAFGFDWPVAQFTPPGGDPARRDAAEAFVAKLASADAERRFAAIGLRDSKGTPPAGAPAPATSYRTSYRAMPSVARVSDTLRAWTAAGRPSRSLVVIDLSGSMADSIGGGQTKIELAAAAERAAIAFLPDTSSLGLWGFSVDRTRAADWKQLVPLGPLAGRVGPSTRRQALISAGKSLPKRTGGNTGLYSTALAAYDAVRNGYDPASVNSVVLLTDGANTDKRGIDLATLLSTLRSKTDASRPLPLITIAVGRDADVGTLRKISAATGGREYTVTKPEDIRDVFLDAVIRTS